ncbi:MAG: phage portal protein [Lachnospiraceae bacterium]|nr:phage portal protein [Lachnospiraceae bacterium]
MEQQNNPEVMTGKSAHASMSGYGDAGASWRKRALKSFIATSLSSHEDIDWNNQTMRQRSRMLYMAAPLATSAIKTNRTNVIGCGLVLQAKPDAEILGLSQEKAAAWQTRTEAEFRLWARKKQSCDATGINNFYGMQQLALMSWLLSGDVFVVFKQKKPTPLCPYSLRLHLIEADRVMTPLVSGSTSLYVTDGINPDNKNRIFDGVEVDNDGAIVAYHISNHYPNQINADPTKWVRIKAYGELTGLPNILQIMDSERPEQYRGVSYLAQVIEPMLQMRRYTESELTAALIESFFTAFVLTEGDASKNPYNEAGEPQISSSDDEYEMGPGQINFMKPGEDIKFAAPTRPNSGFDAFMRNLCEQCGAALEIPADLLMKAFNASYSASRAALLEAWKAFKMRREWFVADFCKPVYETWLAEAVARGRIQAPGFFSDPIIREAWLGSEWIGPSQGQLDPVKEIEAEVMAVEHGFSTHEQSTIKLNGGQWAANMRQLTDENKKIAAASAAGQPAQTGKEE